MVSHAPAHLLFPHAMVLIPWRWRKAMVWHLGMLSHVYTKKLPSVASNSSGDISQSINPVQKVRQKCVIVLGQQGC